MERIILTTGGTGGHIFPALAVAEEARRRYGSLEALFVGSLHGPEAELARKAGLDFVGLPVRGFLGRGWRAVAAAGGMLRAFGHAVALVRRFKPQVVAGFGGYAAFAPVAAARCCGVPVAVHEQNAIAGVSNKVLGGLAGRICLSMPDTCGFAPNKCVLTGNPVREAVAAVGRMPHDFQGRRLLVMGGSQGAAALNACIVKSLHKLREAGVHLLHQTGARDADAVRAAYAEAGLDPQCAQPFINDIAGAYAWADLVFCRAGATSVAELAAAGRPAVLVPFPFATHDHQTHNARRMAEAGAAMLIAERDMAEVDVAGLLLRLLADAHTLRSMGGMALNAAQVGAAAAVVDQLEDLVRAASPRAV